MNERPGVPTAENAVDDSLDARKERSVLRAAARGLGAVSLGGIAALGINNLYGAHSDIGPVHVSVHAKWGSSVGITSDAADLRLERSSIIPLGVYANVEGTDDDGTSPEALVKEAGLAGDPSAVTEKLKTDYLHQAEFAFGLGGVAALGLLGLSDWVRRDDEHKNRFRRRVAGSLAATTALGASAFVGYLPTRTFDHVNWKQTNIAVGGNTYDIGYGGAGASYAVDEITTNEKYYNTIKDNLKTALAPIKAEDENEHPGEQKINVYSDWHCNYGNARNIAQINKSLGINTTINAGDNNLGATTAEKLCEEILATNLKDTSNYFSDGNHDPDFLSQVLKDHGFINLNEKPVSIYGAKVIGFNDPTLSPAFSDNFSLRNSKEQTTLENIQGSSPAETEVLQNKYRDKVVNEFKNHVTKTTCEDEPNILINHEPQQTSDEARNCADLTVNGHTHVLKKLAETSPNHFTINDGSIGGAAPDTQSIGYPLGKEASCYIIYIKDGKPTGVRSIVILPNQKITVGSYEPLSVEQAAAAPANSLKTDQNALPLRRTLPSQAIAPSYLKPAA